jgi:hypothetical protein
MYCPKCGSEYNPGVTKCAECGVLLVETLPAKEPARRDIDFGGDIDFECILSTFNAGDLAMIKSILGESDINYFIQGEDFLYVSPLVQPAKIMVTREDVDEAKELLKDLKIAGGISFGEQELEEPDEPEK